MSKYVNVNDYNDVSDSCVEEECPHYNKTTDSCSLKECNYYDYKEKKKKR